MRVLRVDISGAGIGVGHDVAGFLGRQAVVQRNRDRPELPGRVDGRHHLGELGPHQISFSPLPTPSEASTLASRFASASS